MPKETNQTPAEPQAPLSAECPICHGPVTIEYIKHGHHTIVGYEEWTETIYRATRASTGAGLDELPGGYGIAEVDAAIATISDSHETHVHWAEWRRKGHGTDEDHADIGDLAYHEAAIADYARVLNLLAAVRDALGAAAHPQDPPEPEKGRESLGWRDRR